MPFPTNATLSKRPAELIDLRNAEADLVLIELARNELSLSALERWYDPDQPRVPAGQPGGGQWAGGTGAGGNSGPASLRAPSRGPAQRALQAALALFAGLSAQNRPGRHAVANFNASEFVPSDASSLVATRVRALDRDEVNDACPRFGEVQSRVDAAAERANSNGPWFSAQNRGTAIHQDVKRQIEALKDENFKAEVSRLKSGDDTNYGTLGSVRIDVYERAANNTTCVYDIKTGDRGLSPARMVEIANASRKLFPGTRRIVVTEVRPFR